MHRTSWRRDLEIFEARAPKWWDPAGPMAGLHLLNPVRSQYFRERLEGVGARCVLELGCGGGILTSSLEDGPWTLFAQDLLPGPLVTARSHLRQASLVRCDAARLPFRAQSFDAVLSSDFLEHAADLRAVVAESVRVLRPGGLFLYETVNRTLLSLIVGKVLLEWVLRYVPVGTHRSRNFIRPEDLHALMNEYGIRNLEIFGIIPERGVLRSLMARSAHPFRLDPRRLAGVYLGCGRLETPVSSPGRVPS
jgi:2-polyprenyl-6-hydroxyphenyl methylase/3-demethylubiquinone-9 3-methyltransferase